MMLFLAAFGCLVLFGSLEIAVAAAEAPPSNNNEEEPHPIRGRCHLPQHRDTHPVLCKMLEKLHEDPKEMSEIIYRHAVENKLLVGHDWTHNNEKDLKNDKTEVSSQSQQTQRHNLRANSATTTKTHSNHNLPVVFAHGMGDSCFNSGMQHITRHAGDLLGGVYSVCIPTGATQAEDTNNGYFMSMNKNTEVFAAAIANDTQLQNGFHAIGFSQGNNVIRGYIAHYNTPPVHSFLSVNGVNAGEGALPHCSPTSSLKENDKENAMNICELLMEQASRAAYTEFAQEHNFQANYWRDPRPVAFPRYQQYAQLATWNNEDGKGINETLRENWAKTQVFVWVLATQDDMVFPREGEHWMAPDPNDPFGHVLPMKETEWYKEDLFGLRTADIAGKNFFESFEGDHLQFTLEDFDRWVQTYLVAE